MQEKIFQVSNLINSECLSEYHQALDEILSNVLFQQQEYLKQLLPRIIFQFNNYEQFTPYIEKGLIIIEIFLKYSMDASFIIENFIVKSLYFMHKKFKSQIDSEIYSTLDHILNFYINQRQKPMIAQVIVQNFGINCLMAMHDLYYQNLQNKPEKIFPLWRFVKIFHIQHFENQKVLEPLVIRISKIFDNSKDSLEIYEAFKILSMYFKNQFVYQGLSNIKVIIHLMNFLNSSPEQFKQMLPRDYLYDIFGSCLNLIQLNDETENNFLQCGFLKKFLPWIQFFEIDRYKLIKQILLHLCKFRTEDLFESQIVSELIKIYSQQVNQDIVEVFTLLLLNQRNNSWKYRRVLKTFLEINLSKLLNKDEFQIDYVVPILIIFHNIGILQNQIFKFIHEKKNLKQSLLSIKSNEQLMKDIIKCYPIIEYLLLP